jgi:ABC-type antimicrobial peptide transport system permease subunit
MIFTRVSGDFAMVTRPQADRLPRSRVALEHAGIHAAPTNPIDRGPAEARMLRSSTLDILSTDYVRTPRANGGSMAAVILRHVLPNALKPIITMAGMDLPWFIGGVVLWSVSSTGRGRMDGSGSN